MSSRSLHALLFGCALLTTSASMGCWVEPAPSRTDPGHPVATSKAVLDSGRTLVAAPGDGAGVFVTYSTEGQWQVSWTCDTNLSHQPCAFDLRVYVDGMTDLALAGSDARLTRTASGFTVQTTTSTTTDTASFRGTAGAPATIAVTINGANYPQFLFFVADGKVATAPSLPIELTPSIP